MKPIEQKNRHGKESWKDKHRCEKSRKNGCRIVKDLSIHGFTYKGWHLFVREIDFEWGTTYMANASNDIKYCPFCGEELL